jgi:hypothetical protein
MNDEEASERLLPAELDPPPGARDRIADTLAARGLIRRRSRLRRAGPALAAAAAAFAAGLLVGAAPGVRGRAHARPESAGSSTAPRFVLFLSPLPFEDAAGEPARVSEYRRWAAEVRGRGRFVAGEKLEDSGRVVSISGDSAAPAPDPQGGVAGYFLFEAKNLEEAVAIARSCPHVKRGGRITVRPVAPV